MKKAVCLLSGGMDSAVTLAIAKKQRYEVHALSFNYMQRHSKEIRQATAIARHFKASHKVVGIDRRLFGGSALTGDSKVPAGKTIDQIKSGGIPPTYVPARNTVFLSMALAYAESIKAKAIFIGANSVDYSGYPDCRPEYFRAFQRLAGLATKAGVEGRKIEIKTPILRLSKAEIVKKALELKVPLQLTWSCYRGRKEACGLCDSCVLRLKGFKEAGVKDPIEYKK